jgi:hypothetical protein
MGSAFRTDDFSDGHICEINIATGPIDQSWSTGICADSREA